MVNVGLIRDNRYFELSGEAMLRGRIWSKVAYDPRLDNG